MLRHVIRRAGACSEPPKLIAFASGNPTRSRRKKTMLLYLKRASNARPYKSVSKYLVGATIGRPRGNDVTLFSTTSSTTFGGPPSPTGEGRQRGEASARVCRAGACSRRFKTVLHCPHTDSRGRLSLQINVQYISCRGGVSPPAWERCYFILQRRQHIAIILIFP